MGPDGVHALRISHASMVGCQAFVDVVAIRAIARKSRATCAGETANRVIAFGLLVAIVELLFALIEIDAHRPIPNKPIDAIAVV